MQLVQIGEPNIPTIQHLIDQMAERQHSELEQLKQAALARDSQRRSRLAQRRRCQHPVRRTSLRSAL